MLKDILHELNAVKHYGKKNKQTLIIAFQHIKLCFIIITIIRLYVKEWFPDFVFTATERNVCTLSLWCS